MTKPHCDIPDCEWCGRRSYDPYAMSPGAELLVKLVMIPVLLWLFTQGMFKAVRHCLRGVRAAWRTL